MRGRQRRDDGWDEGGGGPEYRQGGDGQRGYPDAGYPGQGYGDPVRDERDRGGYRDGVVGSPGTEAPGYGASDYPASDYGASDYGAPRGGSGYGGRDYDGAGGAGQGYGDVGYNDGASYNDGYNGGGQNGYNGSGYEGSYNDDVTYGGRDAQYGDARYEDQRGRPVGPRRDVGTPTFTPAGTPAGDPGMPSGAPGSALAELVSAGNSRPYGRLSIFTLLEDRTEEFDLMADDVARAVRELEPDTLVFVIHVVPRAPQQRIIYEVYRDRAAFEGHERQQHIQRFAADRVSCVLATNIIDLRLKYAKISPFQGSSQSARPQQPSPQAPSPQRPPSQQPPSQQPRPQPSWTPRSIEPESGRPAGGRYPDGSGGWPGGRHADQGPGQTQRVPPPGQRY